MKDGRAVIISNLIWRFAERSGAQLVAFAVSVVLARILDPDLYGTVALIYAFITIVHVFVDSGLANALIQKKDADDLDFSSVFYTNVILCILMYVILFFIAPAISSFYNNPGMTPMIRILGLTVVISGVKNVQQAYVSKLLLFKKFFYATLGGTICAGVVGIYLACKGAGAWALVAQHVTNIFIDTLVLWFTVKWRPKRGFSFSRLKKLYSFGWKLLVSALIDTAYNNLRALIIGKLYNSADLAYYDRGQKAPTLIVNNINSSFDSVLLPAMSNVQDEKGHVKEMCRRSVKTAIYFMAPCMLGLFAVSEPLIRLVLTQKWIGSVFFMRIFCVTLMFYPVHTANLNAIKAVGRSDIFLKLEIIKKTVGIILLLSTMYISVRAMALSLLVSTVISMILNMFPNKRLLDYGIYEQIKDIIPTVAIAALMSALVYSVSKLGLPDIYTLCLQVVAGIVLYVGGSRLFGLESYEYVRDTVKTMIKRDNKQDDGKY